MKTLIKILLPCFLLTACTQVELCPEEEHPHSSLVHVDLGFDGLDLVTNEEYKPKSVQVIASRVVNTWRSEFTLPLSTDDNSDTRFEEGVSGEETGHRLKSGEYTFFFVGLNETYYDVEGLDDYINDYHNGMRKIYLNLSRKIGWTSIPECLLSTIKVPFLKISNITYLFTQGKQLQCMLNCNLLRRKYPSISRSGKMPM